jgi:hypothetical protein
MIRRFAAMLVCSLATTLVVGVAPSTSAQVQQSNRAAEMTDQEASEYYLRSACAFNAANDTMNRQVYGPDGWIPAAEVRRRLTEVKAATRPYARAHYALARKLTHAPGEWPSSVARPIATTSSALLRKHELLVSASSARSPQSWLRLTKRAADVPVPTATIRLELDLPAPGEGC